jgi:hypothetical protein
MIVTGHSVGNLSYNTSGFSEGFNFGPSTPQVVTTVADNSIPGIITAFSTSTSIIRYEPTNLKDIAPELIIGVASLALVATSLVISALSSNPTAVMVSLGLTVAFTIGLVGSVLTARRR